jgi:hypothetical protein
MAGTPQEDLGCCRFNAKAQRSRKDRTSTKPEIEAGLNGGGRHYTARRGMSRNPVRAPGICLVLPIFSLRVSAELCVSALRAL